MHKVFIYTPTSRSKWLRPQFGLANHPTLIACFISYQKWVQREMQPSQAHLSYIYVNLHTTWTFMVCKWHTIIMMDLCHTKNDLSLYIIVSNFVKVGTMRLFTIGLFMLLKIKINPNDMRLNKYIVLFGFIADKLRLQGRGPNVRQWWCRLPTVDCRVLKSNHGYNCRHFVFCIKTKNQKLAGKSWVLPPLHFVNFFTQTMFLQLFFSHLWSLLHGFFLGTIYNCNRSVYDLKTQCLRTWISIKMQAWKCLHLYSFKLQSITTEHHNYVADVIHNIYCQLHYFASHTLCYNLMLQSSLYSEILLFVVRHVSPM